MRTWEQNRGLCFSPSMVLSVSDLTPTLLSVILFFMLLLLLLLFLFLCCLLCPDWPFDSSWKNFKIKEGKKNNKKLNKKLKWDLVPPQNKIKIKPQKTTFYWLRSMQAGGWSFSCRRTNTRRGCGVLPCHARWSGNHSSLSTSSSATLSSAWGWDRVVENTHRCIDL